MAIHFLSDVPWRGTWPFRRGTPSELRPVSYGLGQLVDLLRNIVLIPSPFAEESQGEELCSPASHRSTPILGRVYEHFISQFLSAEGKKGSEFLTARSVMGAFASRSAFLGSAG